MSDKKKYGAWRAEFLWSIKCRRTATSLSSDEKYTVLEPYHVIPIAVYNSWSLGISVLLMNWFLQPSSDRFVRLLNVTRKYAAHTICY